MSPRPSTLLGLVLCLVQTIHMQEAQGLPALPRMRGALRKPSLRVEPGLVVPQGWPVTFVCRGPAWAEFYHLEKEGRRVFHFHKGVSQDGLPVTEARFHIPAVSDMTAGSYRCLYEQVDERPSQPSEPLELKVTKEDFSTLHSGHTSQDYTVENSICLGLAGVVLLILLAILV